MNCPLETRGTTELLVAYSSRGVDAAETVSLEKHLADCPACREFVSSQRAVWQALDLWEAAPVSADFDRRLHQRIAQQVSWWERAFGPLRPLLAYRGIPIAAAATLLVAAGVLLDRPSTPPAPPPRTAAVQVDTLQPEQVVKALDEMDALSQFNHSLKADDSEPRM